jgi:hypothetical protein
MTTVRTQGENLIATVQKDRNVKQEVITKLREKVDAILADLAERVACPDKNLQAKGAFERCAAGKKTAHWLDVYRQLNRFRTSLPSVTIHDFMEQSRRKKWNLAEYDIDLATLLKRAVVLAWNDKLEMLTIMGIGKYRRVHASEIFSDDDCGMIHETQNWPQLRLYQDGESTPVSDLMARQNHIFTVVPKADIEADIDWRGPTFEAGRYMVAFDGAALLLLELWGRTHGMVERQQ